MKNLTKLTAFAFALFAMAGVRAYAAETVGDENQQTMEIAADEVGISDDVAYPLPWPEDPTPHDHYRFVCAARSLERNAPDRIFRAYGARPRFTLERAMQKCERVARHCRPLGCDRI